MSDLAALLYQREKKRRQWVPLEGERSVQIVRPTQVQMALLPGKTRADQMAFFCTLVVDWKGFTEGDLGGDAGVALLFSPEAWAAIWPDELNWVAAVGEAAVAAFNAHQAAKGDAEKN